MALLAIAVGLAIAAAGVALVVAPDWVLSLADWRSRGMKWAAAIGRVVMGVIFVRAAPDTTVPMAFQLFGVLLVAAGVVIAFLPHATWETLVDAVLYQSTGFYRAMGVFATAFGLALAYVV